MCLLQRSAKAMEYAALSFIVIFLLQHLVNLVKCIAAMYHNGQFIVILAQSICFLKAFTLLI